MLTTNNCLHRQHQHITAFDLNLQQLTQQVSNTGWTGPPTDKPVVNKFIFIKSSPTNLQISSNITKEVSGTDAKWYFVKSRSRVVEPVDKRTLNVALSPALPPPWWHFPLHHSCHRRGQPTTRGGFVATVPHRPQQPAEL